MVKLKLENGVTTIERAGLKLICPFQTKLALPQQGIGGMGIGINISPCSNQCPHFIIAENKRVTLYCGGQLDGIGFDYE